VILFERGHGMTDVEFRVVSVVGEPNVGFDTCTPVVQGLIERYAPPIIVVAVAFQGSHVAGDVFCPDYRSIFAKNESIPGLHEVMLLTDR
jgi:hypothetical protein